jgi:hypothetical protein
MRLLFALTLACLIGITCWTPRVWAIPDADSSANENLVWPTQGVTLTIQGTLHEGKPDEHLDAGTGIHIYPGDYIVPPTPWKIVVGDQTYYLHFGKDWNLLNEARKLAGKRVRLKGWLERHELEVHRGSYIPPDGRLDILIRKPLDVLRLTGLTALENANDQDELHAAVIGKLQLTTEQVGCGPIPVWKIHVGEATYPVQFGSDQVRKEATKLDGQLVIVSGTFQNGAVLIQTFELPPTR